jgi:hypothetical protein
MFFGTSHEEWVMLCPRCEPIYTYDRTVVVRTPDAEDRRGWVLNTTLAEEANYRRKRDEYHGKIIAAVTQRFRPEWRTKVQACKTKKALWELIAAGQAYGTFTSRHRWKKLEQLRDEIAEAPFRFYEVPAVLKACGFNGQPEDLISDPAPERPESLSRFGLW